MAARKSRLRAPKPKPAPKRKAKAKAKAGPAKARGPGRPDTLIVGLGASAGGLAALEQFLSNVTPGLGVAYVVVQHLDPEHASALGELLQRVSHLPVVEVTDGMQVRADAVFVIPPNREMEVFDGALLLTVPSAPRGQRMAIDGFFRSLADERGAGAVGVVLSGTGSDGARGLRAIHDAGGLCLVQAPASARFDGMPAAAIAAVPSCQVAPAERLPALLAQALPALARRPRAPAAARPVSAGLGRVLAILRASTGRDFTQYKRSSVARRIERRMAANGIDDIETYARHLREHPAEVKTLFQELLINVTTFFRDPEAFDALQREVLTKLVESRAEGEPIRIWIGGCATGEEAYSIAILLRELMETSHREVKVQMYGTDLDEAAIATARAGVYPASIEADVSPERLRRFFVREEAGYRVRKEIREQLVFAVQDLVKDPPFTRLDLIACRNVFIYMEPGLQDRILALFHYALRPGGVLFLSPAEGIGDHARLFTPIDRRWRLFRAQRNAASARAVLSSGLAWVRSPAGGEVLESATRADFAELTRRALLQHYAPAAVLTDRAGTILYVHGDTGRCLRPAPGQPTLGVADMAREALQPELRAAIQRVVARGKPVHRPGIAVGRPGATETIDLSVRPLASPRGAGKLLLITFQEARPAPPGKARGGRGAQRGAHAADARRIQELTRALAHTRESLQATIEEQQTSHEELQSSNEELQSTNEEVQASNEELETAKEELQSVNEELTTVNAELQAKVEQLTGMQDDMRNLLDATRIGTVFLDERLRIKRFTREASRLYRLAPSDVGRPLADIKSNLVEHDLIAEAQAVLETLASVEREVRSPDGWYLARLLPYRTMDDAIRGVVMTFTDITTRVEAEAIARAERELAARVVETVADPLLVLDGSLRVVSANRAFHQAFGTTPQETAARRIYELSGGRWDIPALRELLERVLPRDQAFERFELGAVASDATPAGMYLDGRRIAGGDGRVELLLLTFHRRVVGAGE
ncbi:MAG TPA: chemotaxis protein CheB [Anaeromyxobacteraceae bacterium]|nr:chemotaxis protein CheB [Anaeromyxobacteraceae bacterium]